MRFLPNGAELKFYERFGRLCLATKFLLCIAKRRPPLALWQGMI